MLAIATVVALLATEAAWGQDEPGEGSNDKAPPVVVEADAADSFVPGEIVVKTENGEYETRQVEAQDLEDIKEIAEEVETQEPTVQEAGPNYVYTPEFSPNDLYYTQQEWLRTIKAPSAWEDSRGSGVTVGVVDTGWQVDHPDLIDETVDQYDFIDEDGVAQSTSYHGTSVAGIAAADTNNTTGVAGIGFKANFVMAKACTRTDCNTADTAPAIDWLSQTMGVKIINLSFGRIFSDGTNDPVLGEAIQRAQDAGALVVASAGNAGEQTDDHYPACFDRVLGVGALNEVGTKADFSNTGPCVDLVAPGERVLTTFDENDSFFSLGRYALVTGTSFSSPQVAGTAALIKAKNTSLTADQIATRLQSKATDKGDPGRDDTYGYGLLNARCSVSPSKNGC